MSEVLTETIEVEGLTAAVDREARLSLGSDHVWPEDEATVTVHIEVEPVPAEEDGESLPPASPIGQ